MIFTDFDLLRNPQCKRYCTFIYLLQFDKLHDSGCKDASWIDRKFWQGFFQRSTFFSFTNLYVFKRFLKFLSERLLHLWP